MFCDFTNWSMRLTGCLALAYCCLTLFGFGFAKLDVMRFLLIPLIVISICAQKGLSAQPVTDYSVLMLQNGVRMRLSLESPDKQIRTGFESLPPNEQEIFFKRRQMFLQSIARALAAPKLAGAWAFGLNKSIVSTVSPIKAWFSRVLKPVKNVARLWSRSPAQYLASPDERFESELDNPDPVYSAPVLEELPPGHLTKTGLEVIAGIISTMDRNLWKDYSKLIGANHFGVSFIAGPSIGVAVGKIGFYKMIGLELEFGADFTHKIAYVDIHPVSQKLRKSLFVIESHLILGGHIKFTKRENNRLVGDGSEEALLLPPVFSYRRSQSVIAAGMLSGFNIVDWAFVGMLLVNHHNIAMWTGAWGVAKFLSTISLFWTDFKTYPKISLHNFFERISYSGLSNKCAALMDQARSKRDSSAPPRN